MERWLLGLAAHHGDRILPITVAVADAWGRLALHPPLPVSAGLIAATALEHRLTEVDAGCRGFCTVGGEYAQSLWVRPPRGVVED